MKYLKFSNRGSTLVEIIVAVAILGIVTVPLLRSYLVSAERSRRSEEIYEATIGAQNLIERLAATDINALLSNANLLSDNASYCERSASEGGDYVYTPYGASALKSPDKTYYLQITGISSGNSEFDALITLSSDLEDNDIPIGISNEMDAVISMRSYDFIAESDYIAECTSPTEEGEEPPPELTLQDLTRSITISASRQNRDEAARTADYTLSAVMTYENAAAGFSRSYPAFAFASGVKDTKYGTAAFSLFLMYDAYYKDGAYTENIIIENDFSSELDYNVFLVNSNPGEAPAGHGVSINYKNQRFEDGATQSRVFTNLAPETVSYRAHRELGSLRIPVSGYLVEQNLKDRRYQVNVKLYESGDGISGEPIFSLDSQRLY